MPTANSVRLYFLLSSCLLSFIISTHSVDSHQLFVCIFSMNKKKNFFSFLFYCICIFKSEKNWVVLFITLDKDKELEPSWNMVVLRFTSFIVSLYDTYICKSSTRTMPFLGFFFVDKIYKIKMRNIKLRTQYDQGMVDG